MPPIPRCPVSFVPWPLILKGICSCQTSPAHMHVRTPTHVPFLCATCLFHCVQMQRPGRIPDTVGSSSFVLLMRVCWTRDEMRPDKPVEDSLGSRAILVGHHLLGQCWWDTTFLGSAAGGPQIHKMTMTVGSGDSLSVDITGACPTWM